MGKQMRRVLVLSMLAAVSAMALAASAHAADEVKILGSSALATGLTASITQEGSGALVVPALSIEIVCESATGTGTIISGPAATASATVLFEKCEVFAINAKQELGELLPCHVINESGNLHVDAKGTGKVVLNAAKEAFLLAEGFPFATVKFLSGTGCPLPLKTEVKGQAVFKLVTGNGSEVLEPLIQSSETIQKALGAGDKLLYGINEAFVKGSAKTRLLGETHKNCTFGYL
ncbi:MAG TPA: hypothetical protein VN758_01255 [Solirubrobacterales bacterium]|nr:hypothetical protein [Solirubrobacterales bacterium]